MSSLDASSSLGNGTETQKALFKVLDHIATDPSPKRQYNLHLITDGEAQMNLDKTLQKLEEIPSHIEINLIANSLGDGKKTMGELVTAVAERLQRPARAVRHHHHSDEELIAMINNSTGHNYAAEAKYQWTERKISKRNLEQVLNDMSDVDQAHQLGD